MHTVPASKVLCFTSIELEIKLKVRPWFTGKTKLDSKVHKQEVLCLIVLSQVEFQVKYWKITLEDLAPFCLSIYLSDSRYPFILAS